MAKYGISRLDLVKGHAYGYNVTQELENGLLVEIDHANGTVAPTDDPTKKQHYVSSVTNLYDSEDEGDFINKPDGMKARVFTFEEGDIITTTQVEGDPTTAVKGNYGYATVGGKFTVADTLPVDTTYETLFVVEEVTSLNGQPAVAFKVVKA